MVINIIRNEKGNIKVALTYIAVESLNQRGPLKRVVNYSRPERRIISLKEIIILYLRYTSFLFEVEKTRGMNTLDSGCVKNSNVLVLWSCYSQEQI